MDLWKRQGRGWGRETECKWEGKRKEKVRKGKVGNGRGRFENKEVKNK